MRLRWPDDDGGIIQMCLLEQVKQILQLGLANFALNILETQVGDSKTTLEYKYMET